MQLAQYTLPNNVFVAPMAGVTDRPFRQLCRRFGAGYAVGEMLASQKSLRHSRKSTCRADHRGEPAPVAVQILGVDAQEMADAARFNMAHGAQIIDINMGCPAKKVCSKWAGSALMQNEPLAVQIAQAVVDACAPHGVPVTVKMRTGWSMQQRNAVALARAFESVGVAMLTVHGRTREQGYRGAAEYDTIAAVKAAVRIPVVANGDIDSPEKAAAVLQHTQADAVMVGRAAQGRPWLLGQIAHYLRTGMHAQPPTVAQVRAALAEHLQQHYALYGAAAGVRSARKHIGWYVAGLPGGHALRQHIHTIDDADTQWRVLDAWLHDLQARHHVLPCAHPPPPAGVHSGDAPCQTATASSFSSTAYLS